MSSLTMSSSSAIQLKSPASAEDRTHALWSTVVDLVLKLEIRKEERSYEYMERLISECVPRTG